MGACEVDETINFNLYVLVRCFLGTFRICVIWIKSALILYGANLLRIHAGKRGVTRRNLTVIRKNGPSQIISIGVGI